MRYLLVIAVAVAALSGIQASAKSHGRYCLVGPGANDTGATCFNSRAKCMASRAGNGDTCQQMPKK